MKRMKPRMTATHKKALFKSYGYCLAKTFSMSAIGHESDLVADLRASTPSNAMEILLPNSEEWLQRLDGFNVKCTARLKFCSIKKRCI
ncbi:exodeoxyribonuclease VII large subunit [Helicobacter pylori]|uniref:exodeoxyribonuclease VII large subunit n=1 Tax=Helicobacter pylori TaxID=210 RepID=UPI003F5C3146